LLIEKSIEKFGSAGNFSGYQNGKSEAVVWMTRKTWLKERWLN